MNNCLLAQVDAAEHEREDLFNRLMAETAQPTGYGLSDPLPDLRNEWQKSEDAFLAYRDQMCGTEYLADIDGSIRVLSRASCELTLTQQHNALLQERVNR